MFRSQDDASRRTISYAHHLGALRIHSEFMVKTIARAVLFSFYYAVHERLVLEMIFVEVMLKARSRDCRVFSDCGPYLVLSFNAKCGNLILQ